MSRRSEFPRICSHYLFEPPSVSTPPTRVPDCIRRKLLEPPMDRTHVKFSTTNPRMFSYHSWKRKCTDHVSVRCHRRISELDLCRPRIIRIIIIIEVWRDAVDRDRFFIGFLLSPFPKMKWNKKTPCERSWIFPWIRPIWNIEKNDSSKSKTSMMSPDPYRKFSRQLG
jgi:hypothetical protein